MPEFPGEGAPGTETEPGRPPVDVFVSHASLDATVAHALVAGLERLDLRCWIAPRDVLPGSVYADGIVQAINDARVCVLVLSAHAIASPHVRKELERASSKGRPIIALCIDDAPLSNAFEYFLSESQWLKAGAGDPSATAAKVAEAIRQHLHPPPAGRQGGRTQSSPDDPPRPLGREEGPNGPRRAPAGLWWGLAVVTILAVGISFLIVQHRSGAPAPAGSQPPAGTSSMAIEKSIAVLPFSDLSEKKDQEYFADGMAEELVDLLTKIPGLRVPARTSSFYFKGRQATVAEIARALGVAHVLEGSVRKSGNRIRITAQLIRADSGYSMWSETFERPLNDVFRVQDEIANAVVKLLKVSLLGPATSATPLTTNTDAYALYLQARALERAAGEGDYPAAVGTLQRAVALDPGFATAWAEMVTALLADLSWHADSSSADVPCRRAREAAARAYALAPQLATVHRAKAAVLSNCDEDEAGAIAELKIALQINPEGADTWQAFAWRMIRARRWDEAIHYAEGAVSRDPLNWWHYFALANAQGYSGRLADAEATYRKALAATPKPVPAGLHALHANSLLGINDPQSALKENALESDDQFRQMNLPLIYDRLGRTADAEREIAIFEAKYSGRDPLTMAEFYACRGDVERSLKWLTGFKTAPDPVDDVPNRTACFRKIEHDPRYLAMTGSWKTRPNTSP